jgi:hypothetical protein
MAESSPWQRRVFPVVVGGCLVFLLLTCVAMLTYPGGTNLDGGASGYSFTGNFFSDLGRTATRTGADNTVSMILFIIALTSAGLILGVFFLAFTQFFRRPSWVRAFSLAGSLVGLLSGICFVGIAFTPADVSGRLHGQFVLWAFRLFLVAVLVYLPALFGTRNYPLRFAWIFVAFALLLGGYLYLLTQGPSARTAEGLLVQVVGQKVIAYASIITIALQSWAAQTIARRPAP